MADGAMRTICVDAGGLGQRGVACAGTEAERGEFCESSSARPVGQLRGRQRLAEPYLRLLKPRNVSTLCDHGQKRVLHVPSGQSDWRHYSIFHSKAENFGHDTHGYLYQRRIRVP
jgi:hypothetical protein